jgi:hypothetical protein
MAAAKYLLVGADNVVSAAIVYDPQFPLVLPEGSELVEHTGQAWIGWIRNPDGTFSEPPPAPPESQDA